jgi:hypothetical protein
MEEEDEIQEHLQRSDENDDEYLNSETSLILKNSLKSEVKEPDFKCSYQACQENYFDDACEECKDNGSPNRCFCAAHKSHSLFHADEEIITVLNNTSDEAENNNADDGSLIIGNANQLYIYNLLRCITEVSF